MNEMVDIQKILDGINIMESWEKYLIKERDLHKNAKVAIEAYINTKFTELQ